VAGMRRLAARVMPSGSSFSGTQNYSGMHVYSSPNLVSLSLLCRTMAAFNPSKRKFNLYLSRFEPITMSMSSQCTTIQPIHVS